MPTKDAVIAALREATARDLAAVAEGTAHARAEATSAESKAENKYDTRATEASYLAAGQGRRLEGLRHLVGWLDQLDPAAVHDDVGMGALVELSEAGRPTRWVLVGPTGGPVVNVEGVEVMLLSLDSPLGEALDEAEPDEVVEVDSPRGVRRLRITTIR
ncbi:MAG: GreA/GreB family elongation factor [Myxococcota bacterium]